MLQTRCDQPHAFMQHEDARRRRCAPTLIDQNDIAIVQGRHHAVASQRVSAACARSRSKAGTVRRRDGGRHHRHRTPDRCGRRRPPPDFDLRVEGAVSVGSATQNHIELLWCKKEPLFHLSEQKVVAPSEAMIVRGQHGAPQARPPGFRLGATATVAMACRGQTVSLPLRKVWIHANHWQLKAPVAEVSSSRIELLI